MNTVKIVSRILFYIARFLSIVYFLMAALSLLALTTTWGLNIKEGGKYFQVYYPFTNTPFLNGDYNLPYILLEFLLPISLYGLFFLLLSNVFKVFFQTKLFTESGIKHLRRFYLGNFLVPGIMVLLVSFIDNPESDVIVIIVLHAIIGIFAYFLAAIFKQGLNLQTQQDLYI